MCRSRFTCTRNCYTRNYKLLHSIETGCWLRLYVALQHVPKGCVNRKTLIALARTSETTTCELSAAAGARMQTFQVHACASPVFADNCSRCTNLTLPHSQPQPSLVHAIAQRRHRTQALTLTLTLKTVHVRSATLHVQASPIDAG